jgi:hypothetical protein
LRKTSPACSLGAALTGRPFSEQQEKLRGFR